MNANAERSARKVDLSSSGEEVGAIDDTMMTYYYYSKNTFLLLSILWYDGKMQDAAVL